MLCALLTWLAAITGEAAVTAQTARTPQATPLSSLNRSKLPLDSETSLAAPDTPNNSRYISLANNDNLTLHLVGTDRIKLISNGCIINVINKYEIQMGIWFSWLLFIFHQLDSHFKFSIFTNQKKKKKTRHRKNKLDNHTRATDSERWVEFWNGESVAFGRGVSEGKTVPGEWNWKGRHFSICLKVFGKKRLCNLSVNGSGRYIRLSYVAWHVRQGHAIWWLDCHFGIQQWGGKTWANNWLMGQDWLILYWVFFFFQFLFSEVEVQCFLDMLVWSLAQITTSFDSYGCMGLLAILLHLWFHGGHLSIKVTFSHTDQPCALNIEDGHHQL